MIGCAAVISLVIVHIYGNQMRYIGILPKPFINFDLSRTGFTKCNLTCSKNYGKRGQSKVIARNHTWPSHLSKILDWNWAHDGMREFVSVHNSSVHFVDHCDTCAVVMGAGVLIGSNSGMEIDGHDCVWRINHHGTQGFEEDVGTKITHRFESYFEYLKNAKLVFDFLTPSFV